MSEETKISIGAELRARREELGYSLKDVAERTRIRKGFIENLEEDRFSSLPGKAYITGFIKVYAGYLEMDPEPLLALLDEEMSGLDASPAVRKQSQQLQVTVAKNKSNSGWGAFFVGFVVVLVLGGGLYFLLTKNNSQPVQPAATVQPKQAPAAEVIPEPDKKEPAAVAPQPNEGSAEEPEQNKDAAKEPPAENAAPAIEKAADVKPLTAIKATGSSLRMLAVSEGSLIITVDQREPQEYALQAGLDLTWKVKEKVSIEMGSAGQALFWLDGEELDLSDRNSLRIIQAP